MVREGMGLGDYKEGERGGKKWREEYERERERVGVRVSKECGARDRQQTTLV